MTEIKNKIDAIRRNLQDSLALLDTIEITSFTQLYPRPVPSVISQNYGGAHKGIDFATPLFTSLYSPEAAYVYQVNLCAKCEGDRPNIIVNDSNRVSVFADKGWGYGWGRYVILEISRRNFPTVYANKNPYVEKLFVLYGHLAEILPVAKEGAFLNPGRMFATTGNTGNSSGPHLHLEVRYNSWLKSNIIDPNEIFDI